MYFPFGDRQWIYFWFNTHTKPSIGKINNPEIIGTYLPREALCGEGKARDKICVVKRSSLVTDPKLAGPDIYLFKGKLGASGMSLD